MSDLTKRLDEFLQRNKLSTAVEQLTPDASTREYFRIDWHGKTAIACVYPDPFAASENAYLDVSALFLRNDLPVAEIYDHDGRIGVIVQEDLGDTILRDALKSADQHAREELLDSAISLIAKIQTATQDAKDSGSVAGRLKFDVAKLMWELEFFRTHYFETLRDRPLPAVELKALDGEFSELSAELESRASVLCHRDFHAANLMIDPARRLRIIDHQDARIGTASYDLVSLLLDRITESPSAEWLASKRRLLIAERTASGLEKLDEDELAYEFRLQTIQRCLKANGTFSYQSANRGKTHFLPFIKPMFRIVLRAAENVGRFPVLREIVAREIEV